MVNTYLVDAVEIAKDKAQYDTFAKSFLSNKQILAWMARGAIKELKDVPIAQIINCIEGTPEVNIVPVDPGLTNAVITGDDTEDKVPYEGTVNFDIRFHIITPTNERIRLIVNVEAQKNFYPGYDLVTRGIYYGARLISSQKNREFEGKDYDGIKKVYSIWVCMNAPQYLQNTITEYNIQQHKVYGNYSGKVRYDLMSVLMLCLGNPDDCVGEEDESAKLLRLLSVLVSEEVAPAQKLYILQEEYHIEVTGELEDEVNYMCNWSEGILERANAKAAKYVEERLAQAEQERVEKEREMAERWSEKEQEMAEKEQEMAEKEQEMAEKEQEMAEKEQEMAEKEQEMAEKEQEMAEKEQEMAEKEQEMAEKEQQMAERVEQSLSQGEILGTIGVYLELGLEEELIISKTMEKFFISREDAEKYLKQKSR